MKISKRKFFVGIVSSILISSLHLLNALFEYSGIISETYDMFGNLTYTIGYSYFYISVLFLLKSILVDYYKQDFIKQNLNWIIYLNIIIAVLAVFTVLGLAKYLLWISIILVLINFIFYIRFFTDITLIDRTNIPTIGYMKTFVITLLIAVLLMFALGFVIEFGKKPELHYLNRVFISIPFIFISLFFYKTMKKLYI